MEFYCVCEMVSVSVSSQNSADPGCFFQSLGWLCFETDWVSSLCSTFWTASWPVINPVNYLTKFLSGRWSRNVMFLTACSSNVFWSTNSPNRFWRFWWLFYQHIRLCTILGYAPVRVLGKWEVLGHGSQSEKICTAKHTEVNQILTVAHDQEVSMDICNRIDPSDSDIIWNANASIVLSIHKKSGTYPN